MRRSVAGLAAAGLAAAALAATVAGTVLLAAFPEAWAAEPPADPKRNNLHARLEKTLTALSDDLPGVSGYAIHDLTTGERFEKNADVVFPVASVIKLPVLLELYRQAEEGTIDLARRRPVDPKARVEGGGVLEKWSEPYPDLSAAELAVLMMDFSDNYATNLIIDLVGMESVAKRMKMWGLKETLLRRQMMDLGAARAGRENVSTPRDLAGLLDRLQRGQILNAENTRRVLEIMKRNEGTALKRGLPAGVGAADKDGELDGVRCGAGVIFVPAGDVTTAKGPAAPTRPFALAVMTTYLKDDHAGDVYITAVTRAAFDYFSVVATSSEYGRRIEP